MAASRVLVIGATGYIGHFVAKASAADGHPTFVLVREITASNPSRAQILDSLTSSGITVVYGSLEDYGSLVEAMKMVDIVICTVSGALVKGQINIIKAMKQLGTIKRFLPSEFGPGFEDTNTVEPVKTMLINKLQIRRAIEAEGIPHTYIYCNCFAAYFVQLITPSTDNKVIIQGDGNGKAVFVREEDIATYTIKALDDPRTLNKAFHLRPIPNIISYNELVALWEKKTGRNFEKIYVPEHQALQLIAESPFPRNYDLGIHYTIFLKGQRTAFEIGAHGVEGTQLYPDVKYTTIDEYFANFL